MVKKRVWKVFLVSLVLVYLVASIGSIFTSSSVSSEWYQQIKPSITPPNYIFPIVWNILFFLIAISLSLSWINSNKKQKKKITILFSANFLLNLLWSIFYFKMQNPILALIDLILLWISTLILIISLYKINKTATVLLLPYLLWLTFAGVLNYLSIK